MQGLEREDVSKVIIFKEYSKALEGVEKFDKLTVLYWMHISDRSRLWSKLKNRGVFATRSPKRPNPIGLSVVKVLKVFENTLEVKYLDAIDGTPVLDIKPYYDRLDGK